MVSFTLSLIDVDLIIATELEDILNTNTKSNLILNELQDKNNIKLLPLEWNNEKHINNLFNLYPNLDYIILSECLYEDAPFDKLIGCVVYWKIIQTAKFGVNLAVLCILEGIYLKNFIPSSKKPDFSNQG